ncbi:MAG: hypothetical protein FJ387_07135 [Verrucomicrobia bacterium]|nr:hypothetical protein [Verrucomicrobiota bacterium]
MNPFNLLDQLVADPCDSSGSYCLHFFEIAVRGQNTRGDSLNLYGEIVAVRHESLPRPLGGEGWGEGDWALDELEPELNRKSELAAENVVVAFEQARGWECERVGHLKIGFDIPADAIEQAARSDSRSSDKL